MSVNRKHDGFATIEESLVIAWGYYDGPTTGLMRCVRTGDCMAFDAMAMDTDSGVRYFALWPLVPGKFEQVVEAVSVSESPKWPIWFPLWRFESEEQRARADESVAEIVRQSGRPELIVASTEIGRDILAVREADGDLPPLVAVSQRPATDDETLRVWNAFVMGE